MRTGTESGVYADFKYYGIGDQGGAPKAATVEWVEEALVSGRPGAWSSKAVRTRLFRDITPAQAAKLPTYKGELELVNHSAGSITSEAYMKRWNRKNEQLASAAEGAATAASWLGAFPIHTTALSAPGTWCSARRCTTSCRERACRRLTNTRGTTRSGA